MAVNVCEFWIARCYFLLVGRWIDILLGGLAATAVALLLALIARDEIGMSLEMIRQDALVGAGVLTGALFGFYSRNPET